MALVVFLRGVNVGGHRTFRPSAIAGQLQHLGAVNIGAAGTFVIRRRITRGKLRAELARRLPFATAIMICDASEIVDLVSRDFFRGQVARPELVRFVTILPRRPHSAPQLPFLLPSRGPWLVKALACEHRFVVGLHQRQMKAIGSLGELDRIFGGPATTRSWSTMIAVVNALNRAAS